MSRIPQLLQRLPELDALLRARGFRVSPDRWLAAHDLLLHFHQTSPSSINSASQICPLISPLFCQSPEDQSSFYELFQHWAEGDPETMAHTEIIKPVDLDDDTNSLRKNIAIWLITSIIIGIICYAVWKNFYSEISDGPLPLPSPATTATPYPEDPDSVTPTPEPAPQKWDENNSLIPRSPIEEFELPPLQFSGIPGTFVFLISLLFLVVSHLFFSFNQKKLVAKREKRHGKNPLIYLKLVSGKSMPFALGKFSSKLRRSSRVETRFLHVEKTIHASIKNAGRFSPVNLFRQQQPEYLLLIDRRHNHDQTAALSETLVHRLYDEHLNLHHYYFKGDPRWCYKESMDGFVSFNVKRLASLHPNSRLIVISNGEGVFRHNDAKIHSWMKEFSFWKQRIWLTNTPGPWGYKESQLAELGFTVAPLKSAALEAVANWFEVGVNRDTPKGVWIRDNQEDQIPPLLTTSFDWTKNIAELTSSHKEKVNTLFIQLKTYLNSDGLLLLSYCAAYPEIHGNLTIALEQRLFPYASPAEREGRLLKLSVLPWCQKGTMPEYLRQEFLYRLNKEEFKRIKSVYQNIINISSGIKTGLKLYVPGAGHSEKHSAAEIHSRDPLTVKAMRGRLSRLDFMLPENISRPLSRKKQSIPLFLQNTTATVIFFTALFFLYTPITNNVDEYRTKWTRSINSQVPVGIVWTADTEGLAESLGRTLEEWGYTNLQYEEIDSESALYNSVTNSRAPMQTNQNSASTGIPQNTILYDVSQWKHAQALAARLDYLTYGAVEFTMMPVENQIDTGTINTNDAVLVFLNNLSPDENLVLDTFGDNTLSQILIVLDKNIKNARYNQLFQTVFKPYLMEIIENVLNSDKADKFYIQAYYVYLMFDGQRPLDRDMVQNWYSQYFAERISGEAFAILQFHLENLLERGLGRTNLDEETLAHAQKEISDIPLASQVYELFKANSPLYERENLLTRRPFSKTLPYTVTQSVLDAAVVPRMFTAGIYNEFIVNQDTSSDMANEIFYLMDSFDIDDLDEREATMQDIMKLYEQEYIKIWQQVYSSIVIDRFSDLSQARDVLDILSDPTNSPLAVILNLGIENTDFASTSREKEESLVSKARSMIGMEELDDVEATGGASVGDTFSAINSVSISRLDRLLSNIKAISTLFDSFLASETPSLSTLRFMRVYDASNDIEQLKDVAKNLPQPLNNWLNTIATQSESVIKTNAKVRIQEIYTTRVYQPYQSWIRNRYPLVKNGRDEIAHLDFISFFGPGGNLDSFINTYITPYRGNENTLKRINFSHQFESQIDIARSIRDTLFDKKGRPSLQVEVKPEGLSETVNQFTLRVGRSRWRYSHGPRSSSRLSVIGEDISRVDATFSTRYKTSDSLSYEGPWAWYRFLGEAESLSRRKNQTIFRIATSPEHTFEFSVLPREQGARVDASLLERFQLPPRL